MENKIELTMCAECETMVSKPQFVYDDDGPMCEKCFDEAQWRAEVAYETWKEQQ